ncbi:hypothetical protein RH831_05945 [Halodesulfurarchaeum sp. HSR-GB]|uniref:hypothetical protein n=1 Tax=Halodesulfurarchaeum sp. HSR-GB TaxID=3074077 RepID=UPI00285F8C4C|nr:hypothetical protein [Halodesulfurarchaeum sp. HSR-GB]MDR5656719.1 hypothetical protein [Halodesulfurarchaeum sp. HSR-GB]
MEDEFSRFIQQSEYDSQKELVGLVIYYLDKELDNPTITTADVSSLLESSRIHINSDVVSARVSDLQNEGLLTITQDDSPYKYRLTFDGIEHFESLAAELEDPDKIRDDKFIETSNVSVDYYSKLVEDINKSYQYGVHDGCLVLTRKLFENFVIDILRAEYGGEGINLYYNTENGRFHGLGTLCGKLREKSSELEHYSRQLNNGLVDRVEQFKDHGNSQAHSVRVDIDTDEIDGMSEEATKLTNTLYDIREEVRIANGSSDKSE